jgi:two-component system chemotaxis response regulator CheB
MGAFCGRSINVGGDPARPRDRGVMFDGPTVIEATEVGTGPTYDLVVIAASAGGLAALSAVLTALPAEFPAAVLVVQHLDPHHKSFIDDILRRRTALKVELGTEGAAIGAGCVIVAPPDRHLLVNATGTVSLSEAALVHFVRPSADLLFESAAASFGDRVIGVVLTGSGRDGGMGVRAVKERGGLVIAQDENTSQFFGMPGTAIETGAVDLVLPLDQIAPTLIGLVASRRP